MSLDRFVYWTCTSPTKAQLEKTIFDYAKGINPTEPPLWHLDRWIIPLCGVPEPKGGLHPLERWVEVWHGDGCVDVITRSADDITNAIADGLVRVIARLWCGRLEEP